ncbi:exopolyphosphatase [Clostridium tyrobutyricum]|uniref:exopolyphosphatase n=1 Tax=Clostridium tyrobutyricum TaxID=1519 RepID=UPI001C38F9A3|nr:exopolyphosphatase [Clostridium tyrobutyricum]MBV4418363.1 exopolyphosphatase [Clostridium tyrobutyricum]
MSKLGIIDIGSNSMRVFIVKLCEDKYYEVVDELKSTVRLGKDMTPDGCLSETRMEMAMEALSKFKRLCDSNEVKEIIAVATEAVRKASNQREFLEKAKNNFGVDIRVLTGDEEAYHDYLGAINSIDVNSALLMDIGGSSTEFILVKDRKIKNSISIPMGAITLTDKFLSFSGNTDKKLKEMNKFLNDTFKSIEWLKNAKGMPIVGIGGSFRTMAKVHRNKYDYPLNNLHNYRMSSKQIIDIYDLLKYREISQYKKVKGISKERADIFLGAMIAIITIIKYCKSKEVIISQNGIRQGVLYRKLINDYPTIIKHILNFSLNNIINKFLLNKTHVKQVWKICNKLSQSLLNNTDFVEENSRILKTACYLHDCGRFVGFENSEKYSFSIMRDLRINGLTHREQIMAAFTVLNFEDDKIKNSSYFGSIITCEDILTVQKMSAMLHVARGLDRVMDNNILDITINVEGEDIILKLVSKQKPSIEINSIEDYKDNFEKAFGRRLIIE